MTCTGYPRHVSEADKVTGHRQAGGTGPVVVPVQPNELIGPLDATGAYVAAKIETLVTQVAALRVGRRRGRRWRPPNRPG